MLAFLKGNLTMGNTEVFIWLFNVAFAILFPILGQIKKYQTIDDEKEFKKIKVKKLGFLFRGINGASPSKDGVVIPMLYVQIQGYVVGILILFVGILCSFDINEMTISFLVIVSSAHTYVTMLVSFIAGDIGKHRSKKRKKNQTTNITKIVLRKKNCLAVTKIGDEYHCYNKKSSFVLRPRTDKKEETHFEYEKEIEKHLNLDLSKYECIPYSDWIEEKYRQAKKGGK